MTVPLVPTDDGWFEWTAAPPEAGRVLVRVDREDDGRHLLSAIRIEGQVSADLLRAIPVGRIEAAANAVLHPGPMAPPRRRASARIPDRLRENAVQGYPDSFYDAVGAAYRMLVASSSRPIGDLAEANEVPATTAQRWVKEARRRGKLPPGRSGKAG